MTKLFNLANKNLAWVLAAILFITVCILGIGLYNQVQLTEKMYEGAEHWRKEVNKYETILNDRDWYGISFKEMKDYDERLKNGEFDYYA